MIPVLGFAVVSQFAKADRLLASIDYPIEHLVIVDNSGKQTWQPAKPQTVKHLWLIQVPFGLGLVGAWNLIVKSTPYAPYWVLVNDDAWFEQGALAVIAEEADPNTLGFPTVNPLWSCIVLGERVVDEVGLYDERFYPLYFDDNDFERRIDAVGVEKKHIDAVVHHENSSSLDRARNELSYARNMKLFETKQHSKDFSWGWSLQTRRANRWD